MANTHVDRAEVQRILAAKTFFGGFPKDVLDTLVSLGIERTRPKGYLLLEQDSPGDSLIVILSGRAKAVRTAADGREVILNFLGPSDVLGEISLLDGGPRSLGVEVIEEGRFFILQRKDLMPVLLEQPAALLELVEGLCGRLRLATNALENQNRDIRARFASGLLRLAESHGVRTSKGVEIETGANQSDLGSYLGISRTNTSRLVADLSRLGVVSTYKRKLIIHHMDHIEAFVHDTPE